MCFSLLFQCGFADKQEVRENLKKLYYDHTWLTYGAARIFVYNELDCKDDKIIMLYSNETWPRKCHQSTKPSPTVINAEHVVPQIRFDHQGAPYKTDVHHIFASSAKVNNYRSHFRFTEVDYNQCTLWCHDQECQKTIPEGEDIESRWSCLGPDRESWVPCKQVRGRIARAVLYFYTMYPEITTMSEVADLDLLKKWNSQFPPDSYEKERQELVNETQGNRNPYIDDPSLVDKAW